MAFEWDELAEHYHDEVITPFAACVDFPLRDDLERFVGGRRAARRVVVDFGCGCGEALELVAGKVGFAAGVDLSEGMLEESARRLPEALRGEVTIDRDRGATQRLAAAISHFRADPEQRAWLGVVDLRRLAPLAGCVDLALAINSICPRTTRQAEILFENIAATVAARGSLIAVFPSLDTMQHLFELHRAAGQDPVDVGQIHASRGLFVDSTGEQQKYFTPPEIESLFENSGLRLDRLEKLHYPWPLIDASGWGSFPRSEEVWDWYAVGTRP